jgi:hypothetical protein
MVSVGRKPAGISKININTNSDNSSSSSTSGIPISAE